MHDAMHDALHPAIMPRQVVFPGLSDAEVIGLVNQHRPGFAGDSLSEEALQMHEEAILSGDVDPILRRSASAAVARASMSRRSPSPANDSSLAEAARRSRVSSTGGDIEAEASDPLPDLLQLRPSVRRRILERQASGMHHSQAFELEGLTATGSSKSSLASRLALRWPTSPAVLRAASPDASKPSRFALRRPSAQRVPLAAGSSKVPTARQTSGCSSGCVPGVAEASQPTDDSRPKRNSGNSACSSSTLSRSTATSVAAAAGAASFAFAVRQARNMARGSSTLQDVVRRVSLPADRATDQSVQSVDEMRQEARERAEKMQEKKHRYESRRPPGDDLRRASGEEHRHQRHSGEAPAGFSRRESATVLDSHAADERLERLMRRMEQLEATVSQGVQRMEDALLSPRGVATPAAHAACSGHAAQATQVAQVAQARHAADGEGFKAITVPNFGVAGPASGSKSPSPTPSGPPPIPPRRSSRSPRMTPSSDPDSPGATRSLPASPYRGKPRRSFSVESTATSYEVSLVPAAVPSSNSPGSGEGSPLGLLQRGADPDAEASPRASPLRRVSAGNRENSWSSLSHTCSGD